MRDLRYWAVAFGVLSVLYPTLLLTVFALLIVGVLFGAFLYPFYLLFQVTDLDNETPGGYYPRVL